MCLCTYVAYNLDHYRKPEGILSLCSKCSKNAGHSTSALQSHTSLWENTWSASRLNIFLATGSLSRLILHLALLFVIVFTFALLFAFMFAFANIERHLSQHRLGSSKLSHSVKVTNCRHMFVQAAIIRLVYLFSAIMHSSFYATG